VPLSIFSSIVVAATCYGYACYCYELGSFSGYKINGMELSTDKILEENLVQCIFHQPLGDFTFSGTITLNIHWSFLPRSQ
jgi:hypothetical protein